MSYRRALFGLLLATLVAAYGWTALTDGVDSPGKGPRPSPICDVDPAEGQAAIAAAIEGCRDSSTVRFPPNRSYPRPARSR